ncbi:MAG: GNAT family N-acetyltransferase [Clostridia bacterium]|nr:GNAT family N-acetyltransferase [Clostridia bacterium]
MQIRRANQSDIDRINCLLHQVLDVHYKGRPDIFKENAKKYTDDELKQIITDDERPIFVCVDEENYVLGYAFCIIENNENNVLKPIKTLYIDDLCVDENMRGKHIGKSLYEYVLDYAKSIDCYNVTLNVWSCNENALSFYKKLGLDIQKIYMEKIL